VSIARAVAAFGGLVLGAAGLWALMDPRSFFEVIATYPPYNHHLLHDIGAFNLGLGAALLLSLVWRDSLLVALTGVGIGATAHALAHWADQHLGGSPLDPPLLTVFALILLSGAFIRWREVRA
jgi:hypothetical protein